MTLIRASPRSGLGSNRTCYFDSIIAVLVTNSWYQNMAERLLVTQALRRGRCDFTIVARREPPEPPGQLAN